MTATEARRDGAPCPYCSTNNVDAARFCCACGGALKAPAACPSCATRLAPTDKFCANCGARMIGARPPGSQVSLQPPAEVPPAAPPPKVDPRVLPAEALVEQLREPRRGKSNIGINLLAFVAVLLVFIVFMREWNKGRPKEAAMFGGGAPAAAPAGGDPAPSGPGVSGTVKLGPGMSAQGSTLFVIVRMAGTPDRGPPLAVKKIDAPVMPVAFEVGPGDVMLKGMPFTGPFDVYARLDGDGDPMTRDPDDLVSSAPAKQVMPGTPTELLLDRKLRDASAALPAEAPAPAPAADPAAPPAGAPAPQGAPSAGGPIRGEVRIDPALGAAPAGTLFIIVRTAGSPDRGPPVAVKKIDQPRFPQSFEVGPGDVMFQGMPFIGPFDLYARLDADGNAMTRVPGDLEQAAPKAAVTPGSQVVLSLDRRR